MRHLKNVVKSRVIPSVLFYKTTFNSKHHLNYQVGLSPIFIIGSGRSGNTLIRRILTNEDSLYIPPETYVLGQLIDDYERYAKLEWPILLRTTLSHLSLSEDFQYFPTPYLRRLYLDLLKVPKPERALSTILNAFYLVMANIVKPGTTRWGDKTPINVFALNQLDKVFPNAQYIHLVRNVYDVASSYVKMGRYSTIEEAAARWKTANECVEDFRPKAENRIITTKYEDVVKYPRNEIKRICDFLNLKYSKELIDNPGDPKILGDVKIAHYENIQSRVSERSVGGGIKAMTGAEIKWVARISESLNTKYGY